MFDIGWAELFIIAAVALIVLGPQEFPVVMRKLGQWVGALRRQASAWQAQMEDATKGLDAKDLDDNNDKKGDGQ